RSDPLAGRRARSGRVRATAPPRRPRTVPQPLEHALTQLRRRRALLLPAEPETEPNGPKRYPVCLTRSLLGRIPGSPDFKGALGAAPAGTAVFSGQVWLGAGERPRMALDGVSGIWRLAGPGRHDAFATLREIRIPRDACPVSSRLVEVGRGVVERRHRIPLRYHPGAWL